MGSQFENDVRKGLTDFPKHLNSKYFYDDKGDKLFQQIMEMPEYYLTGCEYEILDKHKKTITEFFTAEQGFDLIELGAGDGKKTKILLKHWAEKNLEVNYIPIDISQHVLNELSNSLANEIPELKVIPWQGSYFDVLKKLSKAGSRKKVIMVLGSNIGNLLHPHAVEFLRNIQKAMNKNDMLFIGFDQKKDPRVILNAYNDKAGITETFNKNILVRINKELQANFNPDDFIHWPVYNPETGTTKSYLVNTKAQTVHIGKLNLDVNFKKYESIHLEISQKYDDDTVSWLAQEAGLKIVQEFSDSKGYYKDYLLVRS